LTNYFIKWPSSLNVLTAVKDVCDTETQACKNIDESKWSRPRFYLDGVEQPADMISSGYGTLPPNYEQN